MKGMLGKMDPVGGGLRLCECFVTVRRSARNPKRMVEL
jgi:thiosulfate reductase/polysulfide reductase chain A